MVDMDRNGRLPRLSNFCEHLLYAGVGLGIFCRLRCVSSNWQISRRALLF
jgi:hypothetical protein